MASSKIVCLIIFATMVVFAPHGSQGFTCSELLKEAMPCMNYLTKGGSLPANCCAGVKNLAGLVKTRPDRQQACQCIMPVVKSLGINYELANKLPAACGVDAKLDIKPNMDCSTVEH